MKSGRTFCRRTRLANWFGLVGILLSSQLKAALVSYEWSSGFNNSGNIPDGNPSGWSDTRTVSTGYSSIESIAVTLNLSGGFNGDLYAHLSHSSGFAILLNRVGKTAGNPFGYDDAGFVITLSDLGDVTTDIHAYGGNGGEQVTGTYQSDGRNVDPDLVLDTDSRNARLTSFEGLDPNGSWTLYFTDLSNGEQSTLVSWGMEIQATPEPANVALLIFASLLVLHGFVSWCRKKNTTPSQRRS